MNESKILKGDVKIVLSVIQELEEEEKANESSENENNYSDDESDRISTIYDNNNRDESPLSSSCNLQDKIEKFKQLIHYFDEFYDNDWKNKMDSLYEKLENSTLSKKEKIKIMLCGAYLKNRGDILGEAPGRELKKIFLPEDIKKEIDAHLISNQHLQAGLKELEKKKNDENGTQIFDASNYDHKLVYILHNVIL
jgi:gluconate kinase